LDNSTSEDDGLSVKDEDSIANDDGPITKDDEIAKDDGGLFLQFTSEDDCGLSKQFTFIGSLKSICSFEPTVIVLIGLSLNKIFGVDRCHLFVTYATTIQKSNDRDS